MTRIAIRSDQTGPTVWWSVPVFGVQIRVAISVTNRDDKEKKIIKGFRIGNSGDLLLREKTGLRIEDEGFRKENNVKLD